MIVILKMIKFLWVFVCGKLYTRVGGILSSVRRRRRRGLRIQVRKRSTVFFMKPYSRRAPEKVVKGEKYVVNKNTFVYTR